MAAERICEGMRRGSKKVILNNVVLHIPIFAMLQQLKTRANSSQDLSSKGVAFLSTSLNLKFK
jgi:hypothetical protein